MRHCRLCWCLCQRSSCDAFALRSRRSHDHGLRQFYRTVNLGALPMVQLGSLRDARLIPNRFALLLNYICPSGTLQNCLNKGCPTGTVQPLPRSRELRSEDHLSLRRLDKTISVRKRRIQCPRLSLRPCRPISLLRIAFVRRTCTPRPGRGDVLVAVDDRRLLEQIETLTALAHRPGASGGSLSAFALRVYWPICHSLVESNFPFVNSALTCANATRRSTEGTNVRIPTSHQ